MRCFICHQEIIPEVNWANVWKIDAKQTCCSECLSLFENINPGCPKCGRPSVEEICFDCVRWGRDKEDPLEKNISLFRYNDFAKDWVARWKYRGDYELIYSIAPQVKKVWREAGWNYSVVAVPLSEERLSERGFNQSEALIRTLDKEPLHLLERQGSEKQSKKRRTERMAAANPFKLKKTIHQPVVLVDDIYTTGTTVRHIATLLKENGCPKVYSFTLFR
ncbi:ComF family protein [Halobacillus fulvus]|nr:ComF family protein [Halobacillus fulvus]